MLRPHIVVGHRQRLFPVLLWPVLVLARQVRLIDNRTVPGDHHPVCIGFLESGQSWTYGTNQLRIEGLFLRRGARPSVLEPGYIATVLNCCAPRDGPAQDETQRQ